ncbi:MAG: hypothetical protein ABIF77_09615 [bacterium]
MSATIIHAAAVASRPHRTIPESSLQFNQGRTGAPRRERLHG